MRKLIALVLLALCLPVQAEVWTARYGVAETFNFKLYNADGTLDVDEADGGTEVSVSCNEGAETTATNDFVDEGTFYSIALTSGEMSCERVAVVVAATTTEVFFIQTTDHASAMNPAFGQTGDSFARLGAPAGASVSADIVVLDDFVDDLETRLGTPSNLGGGATVAGNLSDIEAQTDDIGTAGAGLTNIDLPNQTMDITGTLATVTTVTNGVNATSISGDTAAADALELAFDGTATGARLFGIERLGTAQSATGTTLVVDSGAAYGDNALVGMTAMACGSTQGYCQSLPVGSNVGATDTLTLDGTWPVTPSGTITFYLFGTAPSTGGSGLDAAGVRAAVGLASANLDTQLGAIDDAVDTEVAAILVDTGTTLQAELDGIQADTEDLQAQIGTAGAGLTAADDAIMTRVGAPVGASISADIAVVAGQTDDIGAAGAGLTALATQASVNTVDDLLDTEMPALTTAVADIPTNAELATALGTADDAVLAAIAALNNLSAAQVRDLTIEDQGGGVSLACAISVVLAYASGDLVTSGSTSTFEDPSGTETRSVGTVTSAGNRTAAITCPTF